MPKQRTEKQIVADCNKLARTFYTMQGYQVPDGYEFHHARHPQELLMWSLAAEATRTLTSTDPDDARMELEE